MDFQGKYNVKSPAVKRLMREACELQEATEEYWAHPLEDNLFEWHFTVQGPPATDFEGGVYHGRILLPAEYPMKPPNIILLTPNGRFETNKKICLSISGHHPETWQPSWSIRTALMALIAFMPTPGNGTIGSLDYTTEERQTLARKSHTWECTNCGRILLQLSSSATSKPLTKEESVLISQIALKAEEVLPERKESESSDANGDVPPSDPSAAASDNSEVRHRVSARTDSTEAAMSNTTPIQLPIAVESSGDVKNLVMWVLIVAIGVLIYRRLFLI